MAGTTTEHQINYGFDTAGRLSTITAADPNGGAAKVHTYGYLANSGNLIETITSPAHKVVNTYEADRNGLLSKQNSKLDNTLIGSYQYAMNSLGQRTSITKNGLAYPAATVETVGYDSKGQVVKTTDNTTAINNRAYTFDGIGNRLTSQDGSVGVSPASTYTVNAVNEITSITTGNTTINTTHDDDGNMLTGTLPEDANGATLVWDAQNRLTKITKSDNTIIEYTYDYQSRRISKTIGTTKTSWIYNAWNPIAEYSNTGLTKTLTWGQDINGGIQSAGGVGGLLQETHHYPPLDSHYYPLYDGNGNIADYINTAAAVLAHYQYDAFGNTIVKTGFKANDFAHRFSTKQLGAETGLYYYGYRYYDPVTGRWLSRDPIEEKGGVNLYGFVGNNPIGRWDKLGLDVDYYIDARKGYSVKRSSLAFQAMTYHGHTGAYSITPKLGKCPKCLIIYIHGYNQSIADTKKYDDSISDGYKASKCGLCQIATFSWKSDFGWSDFKTSIGAADVTAPVLVKVIKDIKLKCPSTRIHLVSHSLGARVLLEALNVLGRKGYVDDVALIAPAVDNESLQAGEDYGDVNKYVNNIYGTYNSEDDVLAAYAASQFNVALGDGGYDNWKKKQANVTLENYENLWKSHPGDDGHGAILHSKYYGDFWRRIKRRGLLD